MKCELIKAMRRNQLLDIMYIAKDGVISKRRIKIVKMIDEKFQAYCFTKNAKRTFIIDSVLAIAPVVYKERGVV